MIPPSVFFLHYILFYLPMTLSTMVGISKNIKKKKNHLKEFEGMQKSLPQLLF